MLRARRRASLACPARSQPGSRVWGVPVRDVALRAVARRAMCRGPQAGSPLALMASAVVLGVVYAVVARRTRILRWVVASHALVNLVSLSTYAALI